MRQSILCVEIGDVIVQLFYLLLPVPEMAVGHVAVIGVPNERRGT